MKSCRPIDRDLDSFYLADPFLFSFFIKEKIDFFFLSATKKSRNFFVRAEKKRVSLHRDVISFFFNIVSGVFSSEFWKMCSEASRRKRLESQGG